VHLISQLPSLLQEDLLDLPAGPNPNITAESILSGIMKEFRLNQTDASNLIRYFWQGLEEFLDHGILAATLSGFPSDIKLIFAGYKSTDHKSFFADTTHLA
jgi:hypothetical protein